MTKAQEIAKYMVETGVEETTSGNWRFGLDELDKMFGTDLSQDVGLIEEVGDILYTVYGDVILDLCIVAPFGTNLTEDRKTRGWACAGECPGYPDPKDAQFDFDFALAYCPNRDDENECEDEDDVVLPLPEMEV